MTAKMLCNCLIGSILLHLALFTVITRKLPKTPATMPAVEAFLVASPVARLPETKRSSLLATGAEMHGQVQETAQLKLAHQDGGSAAPLAERKLAIEATPANKAPDLAAPSPAQSSAPASAAPAAPANPFSVAPRAENSGATASLASRPGSGAAQVMVLGDFGSARFTRKVEPAYPFLARKLGKEGKVILRLALDAQGHLQGIETVEASGFGFAEAASSAIRKSTFAPALRNGRAIASQVLVPVRFVLHDGG